MKTYAMILSVLLLPTAFAGVSESEIKELDRMEWTLKKSGSVSPDCPQKLSMKITKTETKGSRHLVHFTLKEDYPEKRKPGLMVPPEPAHTEFSNSFFILKKKDKTVQKEDSLKECYKTDNQPICVDVTTMEINNMLISKFVGMAKGDGIKAGIGRTLGFNLGSGEVSSHYTVEAKKGGKSFNKDLMECRFEKVDHVASEKSDVNASGREIIKEVGDSHSKEASGRSKASEQ